MSGFPKIIKSISLTHEDVPNTNDSWHVISRFALTFDPVEELPKPNLSQSLDEADINHLRLFLYQEQRRWNHYGESPDEETIEYIRKIIGNIQKKIK